jgi:acyl dehydratase
VEAEWSDFGDAVDPERVRRFTQGIMDDDRLYYDEEYAKGTKYGGLVTPPLFMSFTTRRGVGTPDPLFPLTQNQDYDGGGNMGPRNTEEDAASRRQNLPPLPLPLVRLLNGGVSAEFFQWARPGDKFRSKRRYASVEERMGREGSKMVIVTTETIFENQRGEHVATIRNTTIRR